MTTVLLIDDSPTILMSVSTILKLSGISVETATDGQAGLDRITQGLKPDVVITDVNMPRMDGITFIGRARKAGLRFTPILVLTTESDQAKRAEAKSAGATGWLVKPVQGEELMAVLTQVLPKK